MCWNCFLLLSNCFMHDEVFILFHFLEEKLSNLDHHLQAYNMVLEFMESGMLP